MIKIMIAFLFTHLVSYAVMADQCSVIDEAQAEAFTSVVKVGDYLGHLCEPCGDVKSELGGPYFELVQSIEVLPYKDINGFYNIRLNGKVIDLASVYIQTVKGEFRSIVINAAYILGCPTKNVTNRLIVGD